MMASVNATLDEIKRLAQPQQELFNRVSDTKEVGAVRSPLAPVFVGLDRELGDVREQFLWPVIDPRYKLPIAAARFCSEVTLPSGVDRQVETQIESSIARCKPWENFDGEYICNFEVSARVGRNVFRDTVCWDLNNPANTAEAYASAVCRDLQLSWEYAQAIINRVKELIAQEREVQRQKPKQSSSLGIDTVIINAGSGPRVETFTEESIKPEVHTPKEDPQAVKKEAPRQKIGFTINAPKRLQAAKMKLVMKHEDEGSDSD